MLGGSTRVSCVQVWSEESGRTDLVEMSQMVFFGGQFGFSGFKSVQEDWLNLSRATLGELE